MAAKTVCRTAGAVEAPGRVYLPRVRPRRKGEHRRLTARNNGACRGRPRQTVRPALGRRARRRSCRRIRVDGTARKVADLSYSVRFAKGAVCGNARQSGAEVSAAIPVVKGEDT